MYHLLSSNQVNFPHSLYSQTTLTPWRLITRKDSRVISDDHTQKYLSDLDNMHKVVLETGPDDLTKISEKLKEAGVDHKLWIEQPENFPTCLAVKPYPKEVGIFYFHNGIF